MYRHAHNHLLNRQSTRPCSELYTSMPDGGWTIYLDVTSLDTTVERDRELNSLPIERFCSETCMPDTTQRSRNKTQRQIKSYRSTETLASHTVVNRRNYQAIHHNAHTLTPFTHTLSSGPHFLRLFILSQNGTNSTPMLTWSHSRQATSATRILVNGLCSTWNYILGVMDETSQTDDAMDNSRSAAELLSMSDMQFNQ